MKKTIFMLAAVACLASCSKTTTPTPTAAATHNQMDGDTVNFRSNSDITYTSRTTADINTINIDLKNAVIGNEVNIVTPTTAGNMVTVKLLNGTVKQVLLLNGASSIQASNSTRWVINLKYFSPDYIYMTIDNPIQR
jgi:hypothetical protein